MSMTFFEPPNFTEALEDFMSDSEYASFQQRLRRFGVLVAGCLNLPNFGGHEIMGINSNQAVDPCVVPEQATRVTRVIVVIQKSFTRLMEVQ